MDLFSPLALGDLHLANRITMAPLTRLRADENGVPGALIAEHYTQRASLGLIVTEGTFPLQESKSYAGQPGIETDAQVAGWKAVTDSVHAAGGTIVLQLMHGGRVTHTNITGTDRIVAPSAVAIDGEVHTSEGKQSYPVPHALTIDELAATKEALVAGAVNAIRAGFDGVEVHNANGYLLHQFLSPASNVRDDNYGGSPENRARFGIEVITAVAEAIGAGRTGVRISPERNIQDVAEIDVDDVRATYEALLSGISGLGLSYVSVLHNELGGELIQGLRGTFGGKIIGNSGFATVTTREDATALLHDSHVDAVAVGRLALANPDLAHRWANSAPENEPDASTFYGPDGRGYTDYPTLASA
jgi:2,4-dienoyl-CoA reductase-like NADH-dependent reductase (Old Yellow Enzyme family)